jgi:hypothetical protein
MELSDNPDGGQSVDASETPEPGDRLGVGLLGGHLSELEVNLAEPFGKLVNGEQIALEDSLAGTILEGEGPEPSHVPGTPMMLRLTIDAVSAEQELAHAMTGSEEILPGVFAASEEIPERLVRLTRRMDFCEQASPEKLGQFAGIPSIGLDA